MIDLHFHCLPGIDDGPRDWDEAVALCKAAYAEGTETIVATPHVLRDSWLNEDPAVRDQLLVKLNNLLGGKPAILPGCEYFFSADAIDLWEQKAAISNDFGFPIRNPQSAISNGPLTGLNRTHYLLVEFPATRLPEQAEAVFHEFSIIGVTPVIAHPERNMVLAENPGKLARLVDLGAIVQITAGSLLGFFGKWAQAACDDFFAGGLVQLVASDAHSTDRRPPQLAAARERVKKTWGLEAESALFDAHPSAVLAGRPLNS